MSQTPQSLPEEWEVARLIKVLRVHMPEVVERYHVKSLGVFRFARAQ